LKEWLIEFDSIEKNNIIIKNMFYEILKTINYIHSQLIIHQDIKFENIMVNNNEHILIDFDISNLSSKKTLTSLKNGKILIIIFKGTIDFFDPDNRTSTLNDLYSYGILLFKYYVNDNYVKDKKKEILNKLNRDEDMNLKDLLLKLLEEEQENRINSFDALSHSFFKNIVEDAKSKEEEFSKKQKYFYLSINNIKNEIGYHNNNLKSIIIDDNNFLKSVFDIIDEFNEENLLKRFFIKYPFVKA
jgi:serine/threonine protein kinase